MLDQLVSFDTAVLADKAKYRLNLEIKHHEYFDDGNLTLFGNGLEIYREAIRRNKVLKCVAPTQTALSKWLRETQDLNITVDQTKNGWSWYWTNLGKWMFKYPTKQDFYSTYEMALEMGLYAALEKLVPQQ